MTGYYLYNSFCNGKNLWRSDGSFVCGV